MRVRPTIPQILALRRQLRKNQLACLMLAQGVPLLLAGDEVGNSQGGNNNAYCQDNEIGWTDWSNLGSPADDMTDFVGRLTSLRRRFPQLTPRHWVHGKNPDGSFGVLWLTPQATEMTEADWNFPEGRFLSYVLGCGWQGAGTLYRTERRAAGDRVLPAQVASAIRPGSCCSTPRRINPRSAPSSREFLQQRAPRSVIVLEGAA